jgi:hypothetical protein
VLLHHPFLIFQALNIRPHEEGVGAVASWIEASEAEFDRLCEVGDWQGALITVQRPYRAEYLLDLMQKHGAEKLISAVDYVWTDAGYVSKDEDASDLWECIWSQVSWTRDGKPRKRRFHVMETADREVFHALPERLTVYRGYSIDGCDYGYSWTLDRAKAEWFARRYASLPEADGVFIAELEVSKDEILAYFGGRKEAEVVVKIWDVSADRMQIETLPNAAVEAA